MALWPRLLGTLYALYSARGGGASAARSSAGSHSLSPARGAVVGGGDNDGDMVREAIQESVKNVIFVLTSTLHDNRQLVAAYPTFWAATRELLQPFDFAGPLLMHLEALPFAQ